MFVRILSINYLRLWVGDVLHDFQKNPFEQEVKVEKPQRQEGHQAQKRADYAFYLAPDFKKVQFFVEAKKPSRTLRQNRDDYFQTAKYGWNSQTCISILTDFEEIVMFYCRFRPDFDTILSTEIKYYQYLDLLDEEKFSEFYWLFSREAIEAGNLTKFVESLPQPKGKAKKLKIFGGRYQSIDESFLDYMDDIRLQMAGILSKQSYARPLRPYRSHTENHRPLYSIPKTRFGY